MVAAKAAASIVMLATLSDAVPALPAAVRNYLFEMWDFVDKVFWMRCILRLGIP